MPEHSGDAAAAALREFHHLTAGLAPGIGNIVELLLSFLDDTTSRVFRRTAIPHRFDIELLQLLEPSLSAARATEMFQKLASFAVVIPFRTDAAWHDEPRAYLFQQWLRDESLAEFKTISTALAQLFDQRARTGPPEDRRTNEHRAMFHRIPLDADNRLREFERLFRDSRHQRRLDDCEALLALAHEYDPILTPGECALLDYHAGKLAADRRDWALARDKFTHASECDALPRTVRVKALSRLGGVFAAQRKWDDAIRSLAQAREQASELASEQLLFNVLHELGAVSRDRGNTAAAEKHFEESLAIAEREQNHDHLAIIYNSLGMLYRRSNESEKAVHAYERALHHLEQIGDPFRPAQVLHNLAIVCADKGDWRRSEQLFGNSLEIKRVAQDQYGEASALSNMVRVYWNLGRQSAAIATADTAVRIFTQLGSTYEVGVVHQTTARLFRGARQQPEAVAAFEKAVAAFEAGGHSTAAASARAELQAMIRPTRIPWWVIVPAGITALLIAIALLALLFL